MMILNVNKLTKNYGLSGIFEDISFSINEGEKLAIVGENGAGKSTLLKIIAGIENATSGVICFKKGTKIEYLEQGDNFDTKAGTCNAILLSAFDFLLPIKNKLEEYERLMTSEQDTDKLNNIIKTYCNLQEEFTKLGGYEIDNQINYVINGLKIERSILDRQFSTLSGGERTLINFAKILLSKPNLLLLDEPTNHLDIERIEWLEQYIKDYKGTIIIVSHDRYFLDRTINKILEISNGKLNIYFGNYTKYLEEKEAQELKQFEQFKVEQRKFQEMEQAIKRLKEWGKMGNNPTFFRRAKAIQSNLDRLRAKSTEKPVEKKSLPINFDNAKRGSQDVLVLKNFSLSISNKPLLENANCIVKNAEKVAIIGKNGCGKSTLLKTILSPNQNYCGELKFGSNQQIGYLSQIIEFEDTNQTLLWTFMNELGINEQVARSTLYNFQFFKQDWEKRVKNLSGGEKLRLKLAILLQKKVNLLIFDEPTNHIDIATREVLEDSLLDFKGTIIFVSHDRYFINKVANKIIEFKDKKLICYNGDYDYYINNR